MVLLLLFFTKCAKGCAVSAQGIAPEAAQAYAPTIFFSSCRKKTVRARAKRKGRFCRKFAILSGWLFA